MTTPNASNSPSPSRRDFLKTSTAAAISGAAVSQLVFPAGVHAGVDDVIKIGLVGCGGRGTGAAKDCLTADAKTKIVAMGDAFADRLHGSHGELEKQFKDRIDAPEDRRYVGFDAYQKVIASGCDLVILATPPGFRPIHFAAAVEAGKHVFMEKPVATDAVGVRKVLEATKKAKERGLGVGVGLQRHHQAMYIDVIKRLQDGAIGDINSMRAYWNSNGVWVRPRQPGQTDMEYQVRNWYYFNWLCGDHICEQHIHNLDVINWLKNAYPINCEAMGGRQVRTEEKYGEIYDHFACEYEYADGSRMFSYCRHQENTWGSVSEHASGSKGTADINQGIIRVKGGEAYRYRGKDDGNPYVVEHHDLLKSIRESKPLNEGENGAHSTLTAILGRMAAYSGKMVTWEQALNSDLNLQPSKYAWDAEAPAVAVATPGVTKAF